ncbi:hypothetical protein CEXT_346891 [Caerostris extrusa]|uniref:Uncharacterized protein n=1 Tax=Caerostris extrusa TaxID=172846 RepID=A0AAV4V8A3_CAEEX|nr:hypothetical protein CEXT_346891 [Caerostris extrusa]
MGYLYQIGLLPNGAISTWTWRPDGKLASALAVGTEGFRDRNKFILSSNREPQDSLTDEVPDGRAASISFAKVKTVLYQCRVIKKRSSTRPCSSNKQFLKRQPDILQGIAQNEIEQRHAILLYHSKKNAPSLFSIPFVRQRKDQKASRDHCPLGHPPGMTDCPAPLRLLSHLVSSVSGKVPFCWLSMR